MGRGSECLVLGQNTGKLASESLLSIQPPPSFPLHSLTFPCSPVHHASHPSLVGMAKWAGQQPTGPRLDDEAWRLGTEEQTQETDRG